MSGRAHQDCPFCKVDPESFLASNAAAFAILDGYPITPGHALVVPRSHCASLFDLPADDFDLAWRLVAEVRRQLLRRADVTAVNVGLNDGSDAGQTVPHAHIHVIPRRPGDAPDPRGGVRWIFPETARYWGD